MREASYLAQNESKWRKIESLIEARELIPAETASELYIELTDDLSYAQTHYPNSNTTKYLNELALGVFKSINRKRGSRVNSFIAFWLKEVPLAVAHNHKTLLWVFCFFLFFSLLGAVSTHYDQDYPRYILGDAYVDQTLKNIESGEPMGIYKSRGSEEMFWSITLNNLRVSGLVFSAGMFFCVGSFYLLFKNAIMLGCFQYFFISKGLFLDSFLSIWIHGTIEISCIIIAGAAGVTIGKGFLYPKSLSRKNSFIKKAKEAIKIFISIIPLIILAGFLESFVTRLTESPDFIRFGIIILSGLFIIWYYILFPIQQKKKYKLD